MTISNDFGAEFIICLNLSQVSVNSTYSCMCAVSAAVRQKRHGK